MTEVQVWVLMGLFATLGTVLVTLLLRTIDARFDGLQAELRADLSGVRTEMVARFDVVDARFDSVDRRLDAMDRRIDVLDRDVHMLVNRALGGDAT